MIASPKFNPDQVVQFVGGEGKVRSHYPDSGSWSYKIEMEMGPEPDMGRIGYETTILLLETDLRPVE
ncbi:hypothetical protein ACKFKF_25675 [Phormidesmis sp. 146-12]